MKKLIAVAVLFAATQLFGQSNQVATCLVGFTISITNMSADSVFSPDDQTVTITMKPQPTPTVVGQAVLTCNSGKLCGSVSQPGNCNPGKSYDIVMPANTIQITIHYFAVDNCCSLAEYPADQIMAIEPSDT